MSILRVVTVLCVFWVGTAVSYSWEVVHQDEGRHEFYSVAFGNGRYIACGTSGFAVTSEDGSVWSETDLFPEDWDRLKGTLKAIRWNGERFVAVGSWGTVLTSSEGDTWESYQDSIGNTSIAFEDVTFGNDMWVAVGWSGSAEGGHHIFTSSDGMSWEEQESPVTEAFHRLYGVYWDSVLNIFIAVGNNVCILTSDNGIDWYEQESPIEESNYRTVVRYGEMLVIGGSHDDMWAYAAIITSLDGLEWEQQEVPLNDMGFSSSVYELVVGEDALLGFSRFFYSSDDGIEWEISRETEEYAFLNAGLYRDSVYIGVGSDLTILRAEIRETALIDEPARDVNAFRPYVFADGLHNLRLPRGSHHVQLFTLKGELVWRESVWAEHANEMVPLSLPRSITDVGRMYIMRVIHGDETLFQDRIRF